ncbi:MAG: hypothetical protein IPM92_02065 [Saprospiraceae bacterium]|nr:hypothetical protein [Saprospiraceae bacterium]
MSSTLHSKSESTKPPSSFTDTFKITHAAAIIYKPDSIQLEKIKIATEFLIFDGQMHEYEYQIKYSKKVLQSEWPEIDVLEPINVRFLLFQTDLGDLFTIDLNECNDPYGVILFNFKEKPVLADMTNFEQAIYQYFKN